MLPWKSRTGGRSGRAGWNLEPRGLLATEHTLHLVHSADEHQSRSTTSASNSLAPASRRRQSKADHPRPDETLVTFTGSTSDIASIDLAREVPPLTGPQNARMGSCGPFATICLVLSSLAIAVGLTACSNDNQAPTGAEPSPCLEAFEALADIPVGGGTSTADRATLTACQSYDEWKSTALEVPEATGFTADGLRNEGNQRIAAQVSCEADPERETPVCSDAAEQGILP
jgi:hypothetical protein